ncbi:hypothetical protein [Streptomyces virginiae]|uniref:hypothetical protein n=1 Tax=Streptomyces virginiae TaxID=1961 RepID=UPI0036E946B7
MPPTDTPALPIRAVTEQEATQVFQELRATLAAAGYDTRDMRREVLRSHSGPDTFMFSIGLLSMTGARKLTRDLQVPRRPR